MNNKRIKLVAAPHRRVSAAELVTQAQHAFDSGKIPVALSVAERALALDGGHLAAWEIRARSSWRLNRFEDALESLSRLIRLNPYEPGYFYMQGLIFQAMGQFSDALDALHRCLKSDGPVAEQARAAIAELEDWQETLIAEALTNDARFSAQYLRDPATACAERGYRFSDAKSTLNAKRWNEARKAFHWARTD